MFQKLLQNSFLKNSVTYAAGTFLGGFLNYIFHFSVSRHLSVSEYGELQTLLAIFTILGFVTQTISYFVIKYSAYFKKTKDLLANFSFVKFLSLQIEKGGLVFFLGFLLASPIIFYALHLSDYLGLVAVGVASLFSIWTIVYTSNLVSFEKFFHSNLIGVAGALGKLVFGLLLGVFFPEASVVIMGVMVATFGSWFLAKKIFEKELGADQVSQDWKEKYFANLNLKKSVKPILIFSLLIVLMQNIDVILVNAFGGQETAGYYGALNVLGKVILWINLAIVAVTLPKACTQVAQGKNSRAGAREAYHLIMLSSAFFLVIYVLFPGFLIETLFGAKYGDLSNQLGMFGVVAILLSVLIFESNLAYARHDFRVSYILGATVFLMILGIAWSHETISQVIEMIAGAYLVGYIGTLILNNFKFPISNFKSKF